MTHLYATKHHYYKIISIQIYSSFTNQKAAAEIIASWIYCCQGNSWV